MKPTITVLLGSPLEGVEAQFLTTLATDLREVQVLVLANFMAGNQQIDFVVVTATYAALIELKNFPRPIFGDRNGRWTFMNAAGRRVPYAGRNPWQQTLDQKFALSDEMKAFQARNATVPSPSGSGYFADFDAFVCIYPALHEESVVTEGDHKVRVASYSEIINGLRSTAKGSSWSQADWQRFAEDQLHLELTTIEKACDARRYDAAEKLDSYCARLSALIGTGLPPLIPSEAKADYGEPLIKRLLSPSNYFLLGPTGSAKTFHLHHLALAVARGEAEIPILVDGKRYRGGDFWSVLRQSTAPLFRGDPRELLEAIRLAGLKPVLMVDALNECPAVHLAELVRGVQTFALHFDARLVVTSRVSVELPADLQAQAIRIPLPDEQHKRLIYGHHAGVPATLDLDSFCASFTNAYDLAVAGRCHSRETIAESRAHLYDRYVRECVPRHQVVALVLLRTVAAEMAEALTLAWRRDLFEASAERFLSDQRAPLEILDELRTCRLVDLTDDYFSFEHELLFDYFRAEDLRRREIEMPSLVAELKRPRNCDLLELVLPRFSSSDDICALLAAAEDISALNAVLSGRCGRAAQEVLLARCQQLFAAAAEDLSTVEVACETFVGDDGRTRFVGFRVKTGRQWTPSEGLLCRAIGHNLDHPSIRSGFLDLLDLTEWTLRTSVHKAAHVAKFAVAPIWGEAVRLYGGLVQYGTTTLPCVEVLSGIRTSLMEKDYWSRRLAIRNDLLERTRRDPASHISLLTLLEQHQYGWDKGDVWIALELVERALHSGIYILRVSALDHLQSIRGLIEQVCPDEVGRLRRVLETLQTDNIMENTARLEALVAYGGLSEPLVSFAVALSQFRWVVSRTPEAHAALAELAKVSGETTEQVVAGQAYHLVSRMFEDIFENVYWEAYDALSNDEKAAVLCAAGMAPDLGFWSDWILRELFRYGGEQALPIYRRFAAGIDPDTVLVQDAVSAFVLGIQGCAGLTETPPPYEKGDSPEHRAWRLVGECLFWTFKGDRQRGSRLIEAAAANPGNPVVLAIGDVLHQISRSGWRLRENHAPPFDLGTLFADEWRPIVQECVSRRGSLPSIFPHAGLSAPHVIAYLIQTLGRIGDDGSLPTLRALVDDREVGTNAIQALQTIERTLRLRRRVSPDVDVIS